MGFKIPSQNDIQKVFDLIKIILPFPIVIFSIVCFLRMNEAKKLFTFLIILVTIYHVIKVYDTINANTLVSDPLYKRIWLSFDLHFLVFVFAVNISGLRPILFFLDLIIVETLIFIRVIRNHLAPRLGELKQAIVDACDACFKNQIVQKLRAFFEIALIPYFFFASLFTLRSEVFIAFLFYLIGYGAFMLVFEYFHKWAWHEIREYIIKVVAKFIPNNQEKVSNILDQFKVVPDYVRKVYPIPANFVDTLKVHLD
ncbi:hypothetical protein TVAG_343460 [Trichomonas vaginalis G3]|uniref:Uncharacterized protein n=1 Tax=Trichomonas vaginalis (strain ATCC PRA-98 / G3) TaxID=412133 RepID=A2E1F0_TRIV3|nr:hypothetical protein TVAGG3_0320000 [Trichomonas vaginalis G3]EAY13517.1 hypothetical protein TVAG_343460 [Trichomonas vaginalis G3]KAI5529218.1 hypothetical protein TVAGG3_0320000 [Trichomonas vaginalis G3]|eukprot:XP_001325740.1 hypothetical protein [Trichomonas vaginalis G3]